MKISYYSFEDKSNSLTIIPSHLHKSFLLEFQQHSHRLLHKVVHVILYMFVQIEHHNEKLKIIIITTQSPYTLLSNKLLIFMYQPNSYIINNCLHSLTSILFGQTS